MFGQETSLIDKRQSHAKYQFQNASHYMHYTFKIKLYKHTNHPKHKATRQKYLNNNQTFFAKWLRSWLSIAGYKTLTQFRHRPQKTQYRTQSCTSNKTIAFTLEQQKCQFHLSVSYLHAKINQGLNLFSTGCCQLIAWDASQLPSQDGIISIGPAGFGLTGELTMLGSQTTQLAAWVAQLG